MIYYTHSLKLDNSLSHMVVVVNCIKSISAVGTPIHSLAFIPELVAAGEIK